MLTSKIENALNEQINAELWSSYLYLSMSLCAARNGLSGLSHWMYIQSGEEQAHARRLQLYMLSVEATVELRPIAAVPIDWEEATEMLHVTLMHEQEVTSMIHDLMRMAHDEHDYATACQLQWFVTEQVEEEAQVRDLISAVDMVSADPSGLYHIDQHLLQRRMD